MSVKIRLSRRGRKKLALFDVVVADSKYPRDGRFIEKIGVYNPNTNPATIELSEDKAFSWLMKGATPTDTVRAMLSYKGLLYKKHLQVGVAKGAITQEDADKKLQAWLDSKTGKIEAKKDRLAQARSKAETDRLEAERKKNASREEAIKNKNKVVEQAPATETVAEVTEPAVETVAETAPEVAAPETPAAEAPTAESAPAE